MKVIKAATAGFCFGVDRAIQIVSKAIESDDKPIYTYGPIIHNEEVIDRLASKGIKIISDIDDLSMIKSGTVIIRSHGISLSEEKILHHGAFNIKDATCPFVKRIHDIVSKAAYNDSIVVIVGDGSHPEVKGIESRAGAHAYIINSIEDYILLGIPKKAHITLVAQTTYDYKSFHDIVDKIYDLGYDIESFDTICDATARRQEEAYEISSRVERMIVIGGKNSSNTKKLVDICKSICKDTIHIGTVSDLYKISFDGIDSVGITAGASTPQDIIKEVAEYVRSKF